MSLGFVLVSLHGDNVRLQYNNGGFLPDFILLMQCDYIGESLKYHEEFSFFQTMFPPTKLSTAQEV